jgi:hypothetical protein
MEGDLGSEEFKGIIPRAVEVTAMPCQISIAAEQAMHPTTTLTTGSLRARRPSSSG